MTISAISEVQFAIAAYQDINTHVCSCPSCSLPGWGTQLRCKTCSLFVINPLSISIPSPNNAMTSSSSLTILQHICPVSTHFNEYNIIKTKDDQNIIKTKQQNEKQ